MPISASVSHPTHRIAGVRISRPASPRSLHLDLSLTLPPSPTRPSPATVFSVTPPPFLPPSLCSLPLLDTPSLSSPPSSSPSDQPASCPAAPLSSHVLPTSHSPARALFICLPLPFPAIPSLRRRRHSAFFNDAVADRGSPLTSLHCRHSISSCFTDAEIPPSISLPPLVGVVIPLPSGRRL